MRLVVDTNILVSFFRDNPVRFIIINSYALELSLFIPAHAIDELKKNESDLLKYAKISSEQFNEILSLLAKFIKIIPKESFNKFEEQAKKLTHDKDIPFFALALFLNCSIWSNEPGFKEQDKVEILDTRELRKLLKL
jgi:predicted nucleic acid-binding protein